MPKYIYTAKSYSGETKGGELISQSEQNLAQQLRNEGFLITSIVEVKEKSDVISKIKLLDSLLSVPLKEKMVFARNLSVMISSGLTVSRAIKNLSMQTSNDRFKKVLNDIFEEVQAGKTLSEGLGKYPQIFGELFINMVKVGEMAGNLDEVLKIVAIQLEKENDLKGKVKGAMIYPAVILVVMFIIGIIMMIFVLPKLLAVFKDMNAELPLPTKIIMTISDILQNNGIMVLGIFIFLIILVQYYTRTENGKKIVSYITVSVPIFGPIVKQVNCARFARIYSSLLRSGLGAVDSLKIVSKTLSNYYYKKAFLMGAEEIQKGISLSKVLSDNKKIFPTLVYQIVEVGEETGKTETVLVQLAEFYEDEVDQITKNMSSIIEPLLMVIIGTAVGFFAIAMLQPMYSLMGSIK